MPKSPFNTRIQAIQGSAGPLLIAVGLTALLASLVYPAVPAVTAMAIVAVGATQATHNQYRLSPTLPTVMLLHAAVYLSLYATFVCAVLYLPTAAPTHPLSLGVALDVAASILPMSLALQTVGGSLRRPAESRQ